MRSKILTSLLSVAGIALAVTAVAAPPPNSQSRMPHRHRAPALHKSKPIHVSNHELKKFVKVYKDVRPLEQHAEKKLMKAKNKKEMVAIKEKAGKQIRSRIKGDGMTLKEYRHVVIAIRSNSKLRKKVMSMLGIPHHPPHSKG